MAGWLASSFLYAFLSSEKWSPGWDLTVEGLYLTGYMLMAMGLERRTQNTVTSDGSWISSFSVGCELTSHGGRCAEAARDPRRGQALHPDQRRVEPGPVLGLAEGCFVQESLAVVDSGMRFARASFSVDMGAS
jgi:hypothetical protein